MSMKKGLIKRTDGQYSYVGELRLKRKIIQNPCVVTLHLTQDQFRLLTVNSLYCECTQDEYIRNLLDDNLKETQ